jgi:hypothetical protein
MFLIAATGTKLYKINVNIRKELHTDKLNSKKLFTPKRNWKSISTITTPPPILNYIRKGKSKRTSL